MWWQYLEAAQQGGQQRGAADLVDPWGLSAHHVAQQGEGRQPVHRLHQTVVELLQKGLGATGGGSDIALCSSHIPQPGGINGLIFSYVLLGL